MTYYNENDPFAIAWLKELQKANLIGEGVMDERSIEEVRGEDIQGERAHFFAGIAGWDYALQLAGWPEGREVWTGSCPCQPFSSAGKRKGAADKRHLWPTWFNLIKERKPTTIFGEQVASKLGREWLSGVFTDLESLGYAVAGADLCAAGVTAPQLRQRLFWVADLQGDDRRLSISGGRSQQDSIESKRSSKISGLAEPNGGESCDRELQRSGGYLQQSQDKTTCGGGDTQYSTNKRLGSLCLSVEPQQETTRSSYSAYWAQYETIRCADGKTRRIESGVHPLAYGISGRVGQLRGYGNAIVPQVAAAFVRAFLETE